MNGSRQVQPTNGQPVLWTSPSDSLTVKMPCMQSTSAQPVVQLSTAHLLSWPTKNNTSTVSHLWMGQVIDFISFQCKWQWFAQCHLTFQQVSQAMCPHGSMTDIFLEATTSKHTIQLWVSAATAEPSKTEGAPEVLASLSAETPAALNAPAKHQRSSCPSNYTQLLNFARKVHLPAHLLSTKNEKL